MLLQSTARTEICLHLFNISIYGNKSASTPVFETSQFAVNNLAVESDLQRNTKYTAIIKSVALGSQSTTHRISFRKYYDHGPALRWSNYIMLEIE